MPTRMPPRVELASLPTPLVRPERLVAELDGANLWIKRDDLTGLELSGNKIRKLEYVFADAIAQGADTIVTEGAGQSNHCRATAAAAARLGMRAHLLLAPPPKGDALGNVLLMRMFGATFDAYEQDDFQARREQILAGTVARLEAQGRTVRVAARGASEPVGCWGYIRAAAELAQQLTERDLLPCDVVVATSSGGTLAGLVLGGLLHRLTDMNIYGVPVSQAGDLHMGRARDLCLATIRAFDLPIDLPDDAPQLLDGYAGPGYAQPYDAELDGICRLAAADGILLDPVYSGKAFCAVLDGIRAGRFGRERPVIFIHTGGIFSNFAYAEPLLAALGGSERS